MTTSNTKYAHAVEPTNYHPLSRDVIGAAIYVHRELGPGFVEDVYHNALCIVLERRGITFTREHDVKVLFEDKYEVGTHRLDLLVDEDLVVELKAVKQLTRDHFATVRSYMRAMNAREGLVLNFGVAPLEIRRASPPR